MELYYVDKSSTLRGQFFENSNTFPAGGSGSASINNFSLRLKNARMSCYVPYLIVQEEDDTVRALLWEEARVGVKDPNKVWVNQTLTNVRGSGGSGTAVVPITPQFLDSSAFLYRRSDGTLANFDVSTDGNVTGTSWAAGISPVFSEQSFLGLSNLLQIGWAHSSHRMPRSLALPCPERRPRKTPMSTRTFCTKTTRVLYKPCGRTLVHGGAHRRFRP